VLAAAVHDARVGATGAIAGGGVPAGAMGPGSSPAGLAAAAATGNPEMANMEAMMQQSQLSNGQLLALQQQIQQESQQFHDRLERHARQARHGEGRRFEHPRLDVLRSKPRGREGQRPR
jgi:hypothetical protein